VTAVPVNSTVVIPLPDGASSPAPPEWVYFCALGHIVPYSNGD
jgi:hypothetical protein